MVVGGEQINPVVAGNVNCVCNRNGGVGWCGKSSLVVGV